MRVASRACDGKMHEVCAGSRHTLRLRSTSAGAQQLRLDTAHALGQQMRVHAGAPCGSTSVIVRRIDSESHGCRTRPTKPAWQTWLSSRYSVASAARARSRDACGRPSAVPRSSAASKGALIFCMVW